MRILEKERSRLIAQWKAEALAEAEETRKEYEANRWDRKLGECIESTCIPYLESWMKVWIKVETFIANLPLTIGAIALAIVTLGVVWFKFAEENLDSCQPVHFHSSQCTFPEFPGCFYCDKTVRMYKVALNFHFSCSIIAGILAVAFFAKVFLATRVVIDEMSSPTTASPAGLICTTIVCVFAGRGPIGQIIVSAAAILHLGLAIWFIYMALACKYPVKTVFVSTDSHNSRTCKSSCLPRPYHARTLMVSKHSWYWNDCSQDLALLSHAWTSVNGGK